MIITTGAYIDARTTRRRLVMNPAPLIKRPATVTPETTLLGARERLFRHGTRRLVVLGPGRIPAGMITERDIAKTVYSLGTRPARSVRARDFMSGNLTTLKRSAPIHKHAQVMRSRRISSIVVINDDGTLAGLVTKTGIISAIPDPAGLAVSGIMTRRVVTAAPGDSLLYVESLMVNHRLSRIIIKKGRGPVGMITFRDFIPARIPRWIAQAADPAEVERYRRGAGRLGTGTNQMDSLLHFKALDVMSADLATARPDEDVGAAAARMAARGIGGLPVVRGKTLAGIITRTDIIGALADRRIPAEPAQGGGRN